MILLLQILPMCDMADDGQKVDIGEVGCPEGSACVLGPFTDDTMAATFCLDVNQMLNDYQKKDKKDKKDKKGKKGKKGNKGK